MKKLKKMVTNDAPWNALHFAILQNYLQAFLSYLLFRFKIPLLRNQKSFDTIHFFQYDIQT